MPNWCDNSLTIEHDNPAAIKAFCEAYNSGATMQTLMPCPQELRDTMAGSHGKGTPEQAALEAQRAANVEKYGCADWYDWQCANWGTKWDFGRREGEDAIEPDDSGALCDVRFSTAWSPPFDFYDFLMDQGYRLRAHYFEPGCGFCGTYGNEEYEEMQLDGTLDDIPSEIVDCFGLQEFYADEEAEA